MLTVQRKKKSSPRLPKSTTNQATLNRQVVQVLDETILPENYRELVYQLEASSIKWEQAHRERIELSLLPPAPPSTPHPTDVSEIKTHLYGITLLLQAISSLPFLAFCCIPVLLESNVKQLREGRKATAATRR